MPSGQMHIGHKMVVDQLKWYQDKGAMLSILIADLESYAARDMSFEKARDIAVNEYLTNYIALGLNLEEDNVNVYLQSKNDTLRDLAFKASKKTNFNELKAIYGFNQSTNIAHIQAPLVQVADILLPQLEEFGGPKRVVVPVGVDQDPHIRLTRDIAHKLNDEYGFLPPSSTYHRFLTGLSGDKMSSSKPSTAIYLNEDSKTAAKKVKTAKTGGRESLKEQQELGGQVDNCVIYEMFVYHLIDDDKELCALIKRSVLSEDIEADFCNTGKEGLQKLKEREYQLVILDVMMPGMDGFETLEEIRKESSLPILMFTSKNDSASKVRGLRAGADDYLTKPFDMDELIARIVSLIRRYTRFNQQDGISQQLEFDGLKIDIENRSVTTENGTFELPPKEFDLLLYCAKNQGKILTKQQIYEEVWREEYFYDDSNIMAIISRLRKKLEVNPGSPKYIQTIKGIGYRFNKEV